MSYGVHDVDAVVVLSVFPKTTTATPKHVLENCRRRLRRYDSR
jgi:phage-related protein